jgi:hypothetical protein
MKQTFLFVLILFITLTPQSHSQSQSALKKKSKTLSTRKLKKKPLPKTLKSSLETLETSRPLSDKLETYQALENQPIVKDTPIDKGVILLPAVISEGTPSEVLRHDPFVPTVDGKATQNSSGGGITQDLSRKLPLVVNHNGRPGNIGTLVGQGKNSEETDVNVLGIPLNMSHGGGFNFSSLPQYLWSGFHYQAGPALGAFDPAGVSGSLNLRLWTDEVVRENKQIPFKYSTFYSDALIGQSAVGSATSGAALLAGISYGPKVSGFAGSLSAKLLDQESLRIKFHFIGATQDNLQLYSTRLTTNASQKDQRYIPVLQIDGALSSNLISKSILFYDVMKLEYTSSSFRTTTDTEQLGIDQAFVIHKDTKVGLAFRRNHYLKNTVSPPSPSNASPYESTLRTQITHTLEFNTSDRAGIKLDPTIFLINRENYEPSVGGTLGLKTFEKGSDPYLSFFTRLGYHQRYPTLIDRFINYQVLPTGLPDYIPNPGLKYEKVLSAELGLELENNEKTQTSITLFGRRHLDTRYLQQAVYGAGSPPSVVQSGYVTNMGTSTVAGALASLSHEFCPNLKGYSNASYTYSNIDWLSRPYFLSPKWIGVIGFDLHPKENSFGLALNARAASEFIDGNEYTTALVYLPGYVVYNTEAHYQVSKALRINAGVDNLFDSMIKVNSSLPLLGRVYYVGASGEF